MWNSFMSSFAASKQLYCLSNVPLFSSAGYCNKIGKLMLARLLTTHDAMMSYDKTPETCKMVHSEEVKELYSDLMTLDPPHSQYYKDAYSLVVLKQVNISSSILLCRKAQSI
ncbi:Geranylgeranyl transferase type-2 subunit alpha 1 [Camellia lanceoleosa]|uniref:Geranylgeranyl transferase type-2 subunit alpha 1 n=1 Tax=Camellia lanceoleosa TaxID=1840588 RepID=A0ACC0G6N1_9ERIC|nr:Geranylgeranyl transferase type-2 subunit alpha 1 [Camellia lanceoleosa]